MASFFGGGFDAPQTPSMTWGDEDSVEESKVPDPNLVDTGDSGETTNLHCDTGRGGISQAVTQSQRSTNNAQDWDLEILNHALVHILDKDKVDTNATNDFTVFLIGNGVNDARFLLTMSEDDFKAMGYDINFKTFRSLQAVNKMYN